MAHTKEGVKYFTSAMQGAPSLTGTAGSLIGVLDACLKDGFGLLSVDSIVVASGVATMTIGAGHLYKQWSVLQIAGVTSTLAALNAQWKLKSVTATQAVWDCPGVPDGTASGTITAKVAPLGWLKPFSGTNLACYKSNDSESNGHYLAVDDTVTTGNPKVRGYETMSAVATGTNPFPSSAQIAAGGYWPKSTIAGARPWCIVGDEMFFYYMAQPGNNQLGGGTGVYFGDPIEAPGAVDPFNTIIAAPEGSMDTTTGTNNQGDFSACWVGMNVVGSGGHYTARNYFGIGSSNRVSQGPLWNGAGSSASGGGAMDIWYPNPINAGVVLASVVFWDARCWRGYLPGIKFFMNRTTDAFLAYNQMELIQPGTFDGDMAAKAAIILGTGNNNNAGGDCAGRVAIDILGPWRA